MSVEMLIVELAAEACGVPPSAIWRLLETGRLPNSQLPTQNVPDGWMVSVHDLRDAGLTPNEEWLYEHEHGQWTE